MKPVLLSALTVAVLLAASPAMACRVRTGPDTPETPPRADLIVFTATLDQRWTDLGRIGADLRVLRTFAGSPGTRVDATWSGVRYSVGVLDGAAETLRLNSCAGASIYDETLRALPMGAEVMVMARRTPEGVDVQDLAPVDSPRARELRALANP